MIKRMLFVILVGAPLALFALDHDPKGGTTRNDEVANPATAADAAADPYRAPDQPVVPRQ
jgi:hypothetical protein